MAAIQRITRSRSYKQTLQSQIKEALVMNYLEHGIVVEATADEILSEITRSLDIEALAKSFIDNLPTDGSDYLTSLHQHVINHANAMLTNTLNGIPQKEIRNEPDQIVNRLFNDILRPFASTDKRTKDILARIQVRDPITGKVHVISSPEPGYYIKFTLDSFIDAQSENAKAESYFLGCLTAHFGKNVTNHYQHRFFREPFTYDRAIHIMYDCLQIYTSTESQKLEVNERFDATTVRCRSTMLGLIDAQQPNVITEAVRFHFMQAYLTKGIPISDAMIQQWTEEIKTNLRENIDRLTIELTTFFPWQTSENNIKHFLYILTTRTYPKISEQLGNSPNKLRSMPTQMLLSILGESRWRDDYTIEMWISGLIYACTSQPEKPFSGKRALDCFCENLNDAFGTIAAPHIEELKKLRSVKVGQAREILFQCISAASAPGLTCAEAKRQAMERLDGPTTEVFNDQLLPSRLHAIVLRYFFDHHLTIGEKNMHLNPTMFAKWCSILHSKVLDHLSDPIAASHFLENIASIDDYIGKCISTELSNWKPQHFQSLLKDSALDYEKPDVEAAWHKMALQRVIDSHTAFTTIATQAIQEYLIVAELWSGKTLFLDFDKLVKEFIPKAKEELTSQIARHASDLAKVKDSEKANRVQVYVRNAIYQWLDSRLIENMSLHAINPVPNASRSLVDSFLRCSKDASSISETDSEDARFYSIDPFQPFSTQSLVLSSQLLREEEFAQNTRWANQILIKTLSRCLHAKIDYNPTTDSAPLTLHSARAMIHICVVQEVKLKNESLEKAIEAEVVRLLNTHLSKSQRSALPDNDLGILKSLLHEELLSRFKPQFLADTTYRNGRDAFSDYIADALPLIAATIGKDFIDNALSIRPSSDAALA